MEKEGTEDVNFDIKLDCTSQKDGKEVKKSGQKTCAAGQKFVLASLKKNAKAEENNQPEE